MDIRTLSAVEITLLPFDCAHVSPRVRPFQGQIRKLTVLMTNVHSSAAPGRIAGSPAGATRNDEFIRTKIRVYLNTCRRGIGRSDEVAGEVFRGKKRSEWRGANHVRGGTHQRDVHGKCGCIVGTTTVETPMIPPRFFLYTGLTRGPFMGFARVQNQSTS